VFFGVSGFPGRRHDRHVLLAFCPDRVIERRCCVSSFADHNSLPVLIQTLECDCRRRSMNTGLRRGNRPGTSGRAYICAFLPAAIHFTPRGTCHAISPVFALTAIRRAHGGFWHGQFRHLPVLVFGLRVEPAKPVAWRIVSSGRVVRLSDSSESTRPCLIPSC